MPEDARRATLKKELGDVIDALELSDLRKRFLRSRWLDQVFWLEARARQNQRRYNSLRLITIVAGVVVPALVGLNVRKESVTTALAWITFALSLTVALAAALDGFFHYGDRWRSYRRTAEALKSQGWLFLQLAGPYAGFASHAKAYPVFAGQIEVLIQQDVEFFISHVVRDGKADEPEIGKAGGEASSGS
jgi:hypothetical protein